MSEWERMISETTQKYFAEKREGMLRHFSEMQEHAHYGPLLKHFRETKNMQGIRVPSFCFYCNVVGLTPAEWLKHMVDHKVVDFLWSFGTLHNDSQGPYRCCCGFHPERPSEIVPHLLSFPSLEDHAAPHLTLKALQEM